MPKRVEIDDALHDRALDQCPKYLSVTGFINLILDQGLDRVVTLTERAPASTEEGGGSVVSSSTSIKEKNINTTLIKKQAKKKDIYATKNLPDSVLVPDEIVDCDQLLREFWAVKKGTRSEGAWSRLCAKLAVMTLSDRRKALEAAIDAGWATVYEPKPDQPSRSFDKPKTDWDALEASLPKTLW